MSRFDRAPRSSRELPPAELDSLQRKLAAVLLRRGSRVHYEGLYPLSMDDKFPDAKCIQVNPAVQKQIFHRTDGLLVPNKVGKVEYIPPHHINPHYDAPDDPVYEHLSISLDWRVGDTPLEQEEVYWIHKTDGRMNGGVTTHMMQAGKRISPNAIASPPYDTDEDVMEFIRDLDSLERPLSVDDAQKIRLLTNVLR